MRIKGIACPSFLGGRGHTERRFLGAVSPGVEKQRVPLSGIVGALLVLLGATAILGWLVLGLGIVVKVDASEVFQLIREQQELALGLMVVLVVSGGALLWRSQIGRLATRLVEAEGSARAEREQTWIALGESEAGLHRAQAMARLGHVITGPDGSFESWSDTLPRLIGVEPQRMPRSTREWLDFVHPEDREKFRAKSIQAATGGGRVEVDYRLQRPDGAWIHVHQFIEPLEDRPAAGGNRRWFSTVQDVTERRRGEEALARLAAIVESSDEAIIGKTLEGSVTSWNRGAEKLFGYAAAEMIGKPVSLLIPADRLDEELNILRGLRRGESIDHLETVRRRKDGSLVDVSVSSSPVLDSEGRTVGASKIAHDITGLKRALEERTRQQDQLIAITHRLATLQEKERLDIARELHDRVGQNLSMLSINLERLRGKSAGRESAERIGDCVAIVEAMGLVIQDVLIELKPSMLANYGLVDAVRWHARDFSRRTGITVEVIGDTDPALRLGPEVEMALFRIAQAALNNVAQHARAKSVQVSLERNGGRIAFRIRDDGIGLDAEQAMASGRWGLAGMRERAEAIGGALRIESLPGHGTRITVEAEIA